jgi:hypothetical protein
LGNVPAWPIRRCVPFRQVDGCRRTTGVWLGAHADYVCPMGPGFTQTYAAEGFDQFDDLGDVTAATTFSIDAPGSCVANSCGVEASTATETVTGSDGSAQGTAQLSGTTIMTCQGENNDVNGLVSDGCEQATSPQGTTQGSASYHGSESCNDLDTRSAMGRVHTNPAVPGFDATVGSAPVWLRVTATGAFLCTNDVVATLSTKGGACYKLTVITDRNTYTAQTDSSGSASIKQTVGQYSDGTTVYFEIQKTCGVATTGAVSWTLNWHL